MYNVLALGEHLAEQIKPLILNQGKIGHPLKIKSILTCTYLLTYLLTYTIVQNRFCSVNSVVICIGSIFQDNCLL